MLDNSEVSEILEILENLEDEELAVKLLKEFNLLTSKQGKLLLNLDQNLSNLEWKKECDELNNRIQDLVKKIKDL